MTSFDLGSGEGLAYSHRPPEGAGFTFVFVNALTGAMANWEAEIVPALQAAGHGSLVYNLRGQEGSPAGAERPLSAEETARDLAALLAGLRPVRPVLVGLSIGGLFALQAHLAGAEAEALVLINTLRAPGLRLDWINEATYRAAATGGPELLKDLMMPHLVGPEMLALARAASLKDEPYRPLEPGSAVLRLLGDARGADWDIPYERVRVPVLVLTGLRDRVFHVREEVESLLARLPDAREITLAEAGHLIPMERGAATAEALLGFAESLG